MEGENKRKHAESPEILATRALWHLPPCTVNQKALQELCAAAQGRIEEVRVYAAKATDDLIKLRESARERAAYSTDPQATMEAIELRVAYLSEELSRAESSKIAALESELVHADAALERLHDAGAQAVGLPIDVLFPGSASFGYLPLVPAEPSTMCLEPCAVAETLATICAPSSLGSVDVMLHGIPAHSTWVYLPAQIHLSVSRACRSAGELRATTASLCERLRVAAALLPQESGARRRAGHQSPVPLVATCETSESSAGARVTVTFAAPAPGSDAFQVLAELWRGGWGLAVRIALGAALLDVGTLDPARSPGSGVRVFRAAGPVRQPGSLLRACCSAAPSSTTAALRALSNSGSSSNSTEETDAMGRSCLWWACNLGQTALVQALLAAGAEPRARDRGGYTPLHVAAEEGHVSVVRLLLEDPRLDVVAEIAPSGVTPLGCAASGDHVHAVAALLADPRVSRAAVEEAMRMAMSKAMSLLVAYLRRVSDAGRH